MVKKVSKKARCTCAKCGTVKLLPAAEIDRSAKFLREPCDDKFIRWFEANKFDMCAEDNALELFLL